MPQHIGMCCFPKYEDNDGIVLRHALGRLLHAFALTDVSGHRLYGSALVVYEQLSAKETSALVQAGYSNTVDTATDAAAGSATDDAAGSQPRRKRSAQSLWQPVALVLLRGYRC